jgi:hypothetical protein
LLPSWFKYRKSSHDHHSDETERHASSTSIQCTSEYDHSIGYTRTRFRTIRSHKNHKYHFTRWLDYCGIFYFFIKYIRLQEKHYHNQIRPIFDSWLKIDTSLQFHSSVRERQFDNMFINAIQQIRQPDPKSMARCHLESYRYSDDRSLTNISRQVQFFNERVRVFIYDVYERAHTYIATQLLFMPPYDQTYWSETNYYHYSNIVYYFWLVFWERRNGKHETHLELTQNGNECWIRIKPSAEPIAMTKYKEDAEKLYKYLCERTPNVVDWLNRLEIDRNEVVGHLNTFIQNIESILSEYRWIQSFKGKCIWERQFWAIRRIHL